MDKKIDTTRKQRLRGQILALCKELQHFGAGIALLHKIVSKDNVPCTESDIKDACYYLHGKGLIEFKHMESQSLNMAMDIAYITAAGIDVLEGTALVEGIYCR